MVDFETSLIHKRATSLSLQFLHIYLFGIILIHLFLDPAWPLAQLPMQFVEPISLFRFWPLSAEMMNWATFLVLFRLAAIFMAMMAIAVRKAPMALAAALFYIIFQIIERSYGKLNHDDYPLMIGALCLGLLADEKRPSAAWVGTLFFLLFSYSLTGVYRLLHGGFQVFASDSLLWYITYNLVRPGHYLQWDASGILSSCPWLYGWFLKPGFAVVTALEILAPLALVQKKFRMIFLAVMLPFFILNWFFMNIFFWQNFLLCLLLFEFSHKLRSVRPSPAK